MKQVELKQIREKMIAALATEYKKFPCDRVRCPSLKKMAQYINEVADGFIAALEDWSEYKGRKAGRVYYTRQTYYGHKLTITDVSGKELMQHRSSEAYRKNTDVARFILCELEKENEYDLIDNYQKKLVETLEYDV